MDATGEVGPLVAATRLTTDPMDEETGKSIEDSQVTWSPDGARIAFLSTGRGLDEDSCDLWVMDSSDLDGDGFGDHLQQLTFDESFNCDAFEDVTPQWSPNSSLIAFTSARTGYFDIWLVNADDPDGPSERHADPGRRRGPAGLVSDGTQVIFRSAVSGSYELYSLPVPRRTHGSPAASHRRRPSSRPTERRSSRPTGDRCDAGAARSPSRPGRPAGEPCTRCAAASRVAGTATRPSCGVPRSSFGRWRRPDTVSSGGAEHAPERDPRARCA